MERPSGGVPAEGAGGIGLRDIAGVAIGYCGVSSSRNFLDSFSMRFSLSLRSLANSLGCALGIDTDLLGQR